MRLFASFLSLVMLALAPAASVAAQDTPPPVKGLFLMTDYPAITVRPGSTTTINLRLRNYALDPDRYTLTVSGVPQGWKLTNAIKTTERKLAGHSLVHGGSRLMAWTVGNAKVEARGNAVIITKQNAGSAKIDPLMALFNAVVAMGQNPEASESIYESRGLLLV